MYRTHEVRGAAEGGAVSVVDLKTGETKLLVQDTSFDTLDGIRWTPRGTLLFAEETAGGRLFESVLNDDEMTLRNVRQMPGLDQYQGFLLDIGVVFA
jgi:sugar lactone lactonase YvrE